MITASTIDRIKELGIHQVVSHYVDLKKAGANYKAKSPWTNEKTGSFFVVPGKNIYKCFSSGNGGDAINFVMKFLNCTYAEAIIDIGAKCNERIEYDEKPTAERKAELEHHEVLYALNAEVAAKWQQELRKHVVVDDEVEDIQATADSGQSTDPIYTELITRRRFTPETILQWGIGYAPGNTHGYKPGDWCFVTKLVGAKSREQALEVGLIVNKEDKGLTYDFFRNRITFPIHNHQGRIVGFGGRAMKEDEYNAKYINSSDSSIYNKSTVLYGLHYAGAFIRKHGYAYLMEGYADVISFHQAGYNVSIGTCGTALTEGQCKLLYKYAKKVVMIYDGDARGKEATSSSIDLLLSQGFEVHVLPMPVFDDGRKVDPDDLTRMFDAKPVVKKEGETLPPMSFRKKRTKA